MIHFGKRIAAGILTLSLAVTSALATQYTGGSALAATNKKADADGNIVIVLDAGHGGSDSGTLEKNADNSSVEGGLKEKDLTLKIATYCKAQLEKYAGVTIYMTRSDDTYVTLDGRTDIARDVNADAFISFHINAAANSDKDGDGEYETIPKGAEVYYPNSNGNADIGSKGKNLASFVLQNLISKNTTDEYSLYNRGIKIRNSSSKFEDGTLKDYYAVIRTSKEKGFPGIIIEHAFLSSPYDTENFLSTNSKLKALGVGDANGIVKYFGLKKKVTLPGMTTGITASETVSGTSHSISLSWDETSGATQYKILRKSGSGDFAEIGTTEDTSYTDSTVKAATTYTYTVVAGNSSGWSTSYDIGGVSITTAKDDLDYTQTKLNVKKVSDAGLRKVKITWTKLSDATGYRIYRKASGEKTWTTLTTIKKQASSYTDKTVEAGKKYSYRIKAYKKVSGKNVWTLDGSSKSLTTDKDSFAISKVSDTGFGVAEISYDGLSDSSVTYQIRRKTTGGSYALLGTTKETTFTDPAVIPGTSYTYKVRGYRTQSSKKIYSPYTAEVSHKAGNVKVSLPDAKTGVVNTKDNGLQLTWNAVTGATGYVLYKQNSAGSWAKLKTLKTTTYTDTGLAEKTAYTYRVRAYLKTASGNIYSKYSDSFTGTTLYGIMGKSDVTVSQMVKYFATKGHKYPTDVYTKYGAPTIQAFCQMVYDISVENGVRPEVVFAQICLETSTLNTVKNTKTGLLTFGGDVDQDQCNFCGFGTTGGGVKGVDFGDIDWKTKYPKNKNAKSIDYDNRTINPDGVRDGLTAQIKHLKLYAVSDSSQVPNDKSDPRYATSVVGTAPFVEWLGIPDNPYGKGWAAGTGYGSGLLNIISALMAS